MYLITIHVPIYIDGTQRLITTEWRRSLELLRDSLGNRFGPIHVLAPSLPSTDHRLDQKLELVTEDQDQIRLIPSFDYRCRASQYWLHHRKTWLADVEQHTAQAEVVHAGIGDAFRPISYEGFLGGVRAGKTTIFVQDTDIVLQQQELAAGTSLANRAKARFYGLIHERLCRRGVSLADLSLLKGSALMRRYGRFAKNARNFHDTSYYSSDLVPEQSLEERRQRRQQGQPFRLVYCGRLVARKGVDHSIHILRILRDRGANVTFDIIGAGTESETLKHLIESSGLTDIVRVLGPLPYGRDLIHKLAEYDGLLFTPLAEDTPRMIFDGYAAGLPLIAYDIGYVQERAEEESATLLLPRGDWNTAADLIYKLIHHPDSLAELTHKARDAGVYHAADNWYRRRAEWTFEAVERHQNQARR